MLSLTILPSLRRAVGALLFLAVCAPGAARAQEPGPGDFDLVMQLDKEFYIAGEDVNMRVGLVAREAGVQGWSYGVVHDTNELRVQSVTTDGTDVPSVFDGGFNQTEIVNNDGVDVGFMQAIILSITNPALELPATDFFTMARASYSSDRCEGEDPGTESRSLIAFTDELRQSPGSLPVALSLSVGNASIVPARIDDGNVTVRCQGTPGEVAEDLVLSVDQQETILVADESTEVDLNVLVTNNTEATNFAFLGWSYAVAVDTSDVNIVGARPGVDSQALNGGMGPEFTHYEPNDQSPDGSVMGLTVGVVISLGPPATEVLSLAPGESRHIDTITISSARTVDGSSQRTTLQFVNEVLGGSEVDPPADPIEIIFNEDGISLTPDFSTDKSVLLAPQNICAPPPAPFPACGTKEDVTFADCPQGSTYCMQLPGTPDVDPVFIRGDTNSDSKVNIADGIALLRGLFYGDMEHLTDCTEARDANGDAKVNLADAIYIFCWRLQLN